MKIKKLIKDTPIKNIRGSKEVEITGVCANSKLVAPGNLFIARKGSSEDGTRFIPEAVAAGASAVVTDIFDPMLKDVTQILHPQASHIEALLAANYYEHPADELLMVGITGTNGKTTSSFLIKGMLEALKGPCGLIGTIEYHVGNHRYQATRTTPDACSNQKMLREMVLHGCKSAVMEVTSHALMQNRTEYIDFDVAVFTNLTQDHLDYHQTMEEYCKAKNRLFRSLKAPSIKRKKNFVPTAVVNADSPWFKQITDGCPAKILTYGIDQPAHLRAEDIYMDASSTSCMINYRGDRKKAVWPLIGRFNVYNVLAAISVGLAVGASLDRVLDCLEQVNSVPGRLQPVSNALRLKIYVDYAHTPDALVNVLQCLQEIKQEKIITVFGCGGDRDASKRPQMAQACEQLSDCVIVTSDNPRKEDPLEIIRQTVEGFSKEAHYHVEPDRRKAIEKAIELATPNDIVLIAGKGHENYQIFAHQTIEFDDRKVAEEICQTKHLSVPQ